MHSSKLTLSLNLKAQTGFFFVSFSFCTRVVFLLLLLLFFPSLVSSSCLHSSFIFHPPHLAPSPSLSVHPSLPAALWQQSVMGLGCRRTVKAPPRPSSSSSAPLHPCCPLPQGPAQSIFTQVMRWAETQRRLFPSGQPDPDPCPVTHLLLFKAQLSKIFQFSSVSVSP